MIRLPILHVQFVCLTREVLLEKYHFTHITFIENIFSGFSVIMINEILKEYGSENVRIPRICFRKPFRKAGRINRTFC